MVRGPRCLLGAGRRGDTASWAGDSVGAGIGAAGGAGESCHPAGSAVPSVPSVPCSSSHRVTRAGGCDSFPAPEQRAQGSTVFEEQGLCSPQEVALRFKTSQMCLLIRKLIWAC